MAQTVENQRMIDDHPNKEEDWITQKTVETNFKAAYLGVQHLNLHKKWGTYDDYWANEQNPKESEEDPGSVTNIIHPILESQISDLVDSPVDVTSRGIEPSDNEYSNYAQFVMEWIWDTNQMEAKRDKFERMRLKYGSGIWKCYFDPDGNRGLGKVVIDVVGPEKFYPDPKITSPSKLQQADFNIQVSDVSMNYLKRRFGDRAKFVRPRKQGLYSTQIHKGEGAKDAIGAVMNDSTTLIEHWSRDIEDNLRLVYMADDVILFDSEWKEKDQEEADGVPKSRSFYEHGMYPFVFVPCYLREGQLWGMGDVELLKPSQDMINDFDDQIRMNARLMGNIQIVVGLASGINPNKWTNKIGLRIPARDPNAFRVVEPPRMSDLPMNRRELGKREAETISGRHDAVEGKQPGSVRAASAILALQEAGNRRVNHKRLMSQVGLSEVFAIAFEHYVEHFTETTPIPLRPKEQHSEQDFAWLSGETFQNIPKLVPDFEQGPGEDGKQPLKVLTNEEGEEETKRAHFDFIVNIGAGLPRNKAFLYQAVVELHRENLLTTQESRQMMKKLIDWPLIEPNKPQGQFGGQNAHQLMQAQMAMQGGQMGQEGQMGQMPPAEGVPAGSGGVPPQLLQALASQLGGA